MNELRKGLPPLPRRIAQLPIDKRGYPVPWFVTWINGEPDFRVVEAQKVIDGHRKHRCWICGQPLGAVFSFLVGPMCAVNRTSAEPPSHTDCAEFAARACPFIVLPNAQRREANMPAAAVEAPGVMLKRNPGVTLIWTTRHYRISHHPRGILFHFHDPEKVQWFAEAKHATREQVMASIDSGIPLLEEVCRDDNDRLVLAKAKEYAMQFVPPDIASLDLAQVELRVIAAQQSRE